MNSQTRHETYIAVQNGIEASIPAFRADDLQIPGIMSSSSGNLDQLGLLSKWRPSNPDAVLTLDHLTLAIRVSGPAVVCTLWEYDGQLTLHLQGARKWQSDEAWRFFGEAARGGVQCIVQGTRAQSLAKL